MIPAEKLRPKRTKNFPHEVAGDESGHGQGGQEDDGALFDADLYLAVEVVTLLERDCPTDSVRLPVHLDCFAAYHGALAEGDSEWVDAGRVGSTMASNPKPTPIQVVVPPTCQVPPLPHRGPSSAAEAVPRSRRTANQSTSPGEPTLATIRAPTNGNDADVA